MNKTKLEEAKPDKIAGNIWQQRRKTVQIRFVLGI